MVRVAATVITESHITACNNILFLLAVSPCMNITHACSFVWKMIVSL